MLKTTPGTYILSLEIIRNINTVREINRWELTKGFYLYFGSAKGITASSLGNRLKRHYSKNKKVFWHIDTLTTHKDVILHHAYYKVGINNTECQNLLNFINQKPVRIINKFGNSDCKS